MNRSFFNIARARRVWLGLAFVVVICGIARHAAAATPCCAITEINAGTTTVSAKETATGRMFSFKVTNPNVLKSLKVGQPVYANFAARQVSIDGAAPCCNIISISTSSGTPASQFGPIDSVTSGKRFGPIDSATSSNPVTPCCSITGIDRQRATVTANVTATGRTFSFKVTNAGLLNSLKVGQGVYANFASSQVSVDGLSPCCAITGQPH